MLPLAHLVTQRSQECPVSQARINLASKLDRKPAKKTMLSGTPGAGLSQSIVTIRGYAPDTP